MDFYDVLIVGAGHAGAQTGISLRQAGFEGTIAIIGEEPDPPYERPPLSKEYFAGEKSFDRILIRPTSFWEQRAIDLLLGQRVEAVDPVHKHVRVRGRQIGYRKLVWSTGGTPRRLSCSGADALNIHSVRRRQDVDAIVARLDQVSHVTVVGGGYIGLEAAAVLTKFGKSVVLLEALDRVLARVAGEELSRFYEREHRSHGVDLRTGTAIERIEVENGRATAVILQDGERIETDMIIVGIGILPETQCLTQAGAAGGNGVEVDAFCLTSLPDIYAIGDCACHSNRFGEGAWLRLESVQNANDQAKVAVRHIMGVETPYDAVPWFWSNQYDLKLQTVGLSHGYDQTIVRGDPAGRSFSVVYLKRAKVIALDCVNAVKDYVQGRVHILSGAPLNLDELSNPTVALKDVGPAA